jgi:hypothetical protein
MQAVIISVVLAVSMLTAGPGAQSREEADRATAIRVFNRRVETYMALHRRLEGPLPPMTVTGDTWSMSVARRYLAAAIRAARQKARQGDLFSPDVALVFRHIVAEALSGRDVEALLTELNEEHPWMHGLHPVVNEPYPTGASHAVPAVLLQHLPGLPEDLEYRILDHDLVLWDLHADLVVDFVPFAFGGGPTTD